MPGAQNGGPMRGRLHIKTTQIPPLFYCIPVFQSFLSIYSPPFFANFSHLRKKFVGARIVVVVVVFFNLFILIFVCNKNHPSSDSGLSKESFMKRVQIQRGKMPAIMESAETRNCVSKAMCELSSSQESSSTQSVKEILRRRIKQKRVQQNEERFSRSQDNATLSNWASILSNLHYYCEVRSMIAACGKIHGTYYRFDY